MSTLKKTIATLLIATFSLNGCSVKGITVCAEGKDCQVKAVEKPSDTILSIGIATFLAGSAAYLIICKKNNTCNNK